MDAQRFRDEQRALRNLIGDDRRSARDGRSAQHGEGVRHVGSASATGAEGPLVSVIVVCWNAAAVLGRCLDHLLAQDYANRELIVVDDGSEDATPQIARAASERGELTFLASRRNRGCPGARNLGLGRARGEIVAFIDADGFATPGWLSEIARAFDADPAIGGVASTVFYDDNPTVLNGAGGTVNHQGWAADLAMNESLQSAELAAEALYPMGCGMAVRREALERVGPFDDRMLNYYDDVDYGIRLWRAGYQVVVAADAWIDHAAAVGDSPYKRLLCERHRMRVVLKHAPLGRLGRWASHEASGLAAAPTAVRLQKLRAIAWNARRLPSVLASRRRMRHAAVVPEWLLDRSWGDGFPAGVPPRPMPVPEHASERVAMGEPGVEAQLLHGWFPLERVDGRSYRWAAAHAALLVSLKRPTRRLRLDYAHAPSEIGGVDLSIRRLDAGDPLAALWTMRLRWQYVARSIENHPLELPPGNYEVVFSAADAWLEPPLRVRALALALAEISFEERFELTPGRLEMSAPDVEGQLVRGWFEAEQSPTGGYRWSSQHAAAAVRLDREASGVRLRFRLTPGRSSAVNITLTAARASRPAPSWTIEWEPGEWREETFAVSLAPGDYVVSFDVAEPWSNVEQHDRLLPPENRALGIAISELAFLYNSK
jgi:GT2 family glycosyltransferase